LANSVLLLLVEDEPLVLISTQDALEAGGYEVLTAADGHDAVRLLDDRYAELAGLVTDVRLGSGANGWDIARHARSLKPELPIVYTTGDSAAEWLVEGVPKSVLIQKPYADAQLITAISTLLVQTDGTSRG
jgi:CheY-like chemotaxis protein